MKRFTFLLFSLAALTCAAQRHMEDLGRGLLAVQTDSGIYVNWRITAQEWSGTAYNLYRNGVKLNSAPLTGASNYVDAEGDAQDTYAVSAVKNGVEGPCSRAVAVQEKPYVSIPLRKLPVAGYEPNDATVADLDGDGEMELILKRLYPDWSPSARHFSRIEAYELDGTLLWSIDVGPNILSDVETNVAAYDFDCDGRAEVFMRTSEGTVFGDGAQIGDTNHDGITNYRSASWAGRGGDYPNYSTYLCDGPEFLSLIEGTTGRELDRVDFIERGNVRDWGDGYGHRANKFFFGAAYLDGKRPSLFIARGIYTRTVMRTYDVTPEKRLKLRWTFDSNDHPAYAGQGNHNMTIADVDGDGCDEIVYGSMTVDHDGQGLYSTGLGHGDAIHVGDFDPYHRGLEVFACHEHKPYGTSFRDGRTGQILLRHTTAKDCGRCMAANVTELYPGAELWGGGQMYSAVWRRPVEGIGNGVSENFRIYWDGDLLDETFDYRNVNEAKAGRGEGTVYKFGVGPIFVTSGCATNNYTKGNPCFQGDILGDWREEFIMRTQGNDTLRIYFTTIPTEHRLYTLLHDSQYRQALCWQMCGYNQPPHVSFFLGEREGILLPPPPAVSNGRLVHDGSGRWTRTSWTRDGVPALYAEGESLLFDSCGTVRLEGSFRPGELMVAALDSLAGRGDYVLEGGALCGPMRLDKTGAGLLRLRSDLRYEGATCLWAGRTVVEAALERSPVWVNRFAELDLQAEAGQDVTLEYGAVLRTGCASGRKRGAVGGSLCMKQGAELCLDWGAEDLRGALLPIGGTWQWADSCVLRIVSSGGLRAGRYVLVEARGGLLGRVESLKVLGMEGLDWQLKAEGNRLILEVEGEKSSSAFR